MSAPHNLPPLISTSLTTSAENKGNIIETNIDDDFDEDIRLQAMIQTLINDDKATVTSTSDNSNEPIYAVVDLKTKYERRAKLKEMESKQQRPKSLHVTSGDYEEV